MEINVTTKAAWFIKSTRNWRLAYAGYQGGGLTHQAECGVVASVRPVSLCGGRMAGEVTDLHSQSR